MTKTPNAYQLSKINEWDARNRAEFGSIKKAIASAKATGLHSALAKIGMRIRRLEKSVKQAQRYCDEIGHVRPKVEQHENGDGQ